MIHTVVGNVLRVTRDVVRRYVSYVLKNYNHLYRISWRTTVICIVFPEELGDFISYLLKNSRVILCHISWRTTVIYVVFPEELRSFYIVSLVEFQSNFISYLLKNYCLLYRISWRITVIYIAFAEELRSFYIVSPEELQSNFMSYLLKDYCYFASYPLKTYRVVYIVSPEELQ